MIIRIFYLLLLSICFCSAGESAERVALFNGKDLTGWDGDSQWWSVVDGAITAESTADKPCTATNYIVWKGGMPSDFILECDFKISEAGSNSGIHIRSERRPNHDMFGYQADITGDGKLIGFIYHHKRGLVAERGERVKNIYLTQTSDRNSPGTSTPKEL